MSRGRGARGVAAASLLLAVATTAACGASVPNDPPPEPAGPTSTPSGSGTPSTGSTPRPRTDPEAALRAQLADALRPDDPLSAGQVANTTTRLDVLDTTWLPGWRVVDVQVRTMPHPRRFAVGLSTDGRARYLSGRPENVNAMLADARIRVGADTAPALAATFLDVTRTFQRWSYRVEGVDDIEWRTDLSAAEQQRRTAVETEYARTVRPLRATPAGDGWTLTGWTVDGSTLVRHDLTLAADGQTTDAVTVVVRDLPVPDSV